MTQPAFDFPPLVPSVIALRIETARHSSGLSECAAAVLKLLAGNIPRVGRESAIQISVMRGIWAAAGCYIWPERSIKAAVKELLEVHEIPIGSSRSTPAGYYLIESDTDARLAVEPLAAEIRSLARRCRVLSPKSNYVRSLLGQLSCEMEEL